MAQKTVLSFRREGVQNEGDVFVATDTRNESDDVPDHVIIPDEVYRSVKYDETYITYFNENRMFDMSNSSGMHNFIEFTDLLYQSNDIDKTIKEYDARPQDEDFVWTTSTLDEERKNVASIQDAEIVVIARDDIGYCTKCKSNMITVRFKQTRSSDEPMNVIYRCAKCKSGKKSLVLTEKSHDVLLEEIKARKGKK
jgi:DNA-directed RNA polymerase subunit M/transcription elongation factor TFIIS